MVGTPVGARAANTFARVRHGELAIVRGRERADPRVEDLDRLRPGFDLRHDEVALTTLARRSQSRCQASGDPYISALVRAKSREGPPSMTYDASVNGAPAKPMSGTLPSSACRVMEIASST